MMRPILLACITLASLFVPVADATACSCVQVGPPCQAFWKTDAVFDATVEAIESATRTDNVMPDRPIAISEKVVKLTVRESWKGVAAGALEVVTADDGAACGYDFKPGRRYLVFAWKRPLDGRWSVSLCSATREFDGTGNDARFLASLSRPPEGGRIFGAVKAFERRFDLEHSSTQRSIEATVRLIGGGRERRAVSTNGQFEFAGLEGERYRLELQLPEGYTTYAAGRDVAIPNPRACAQEDYTLSPSSRITGHLLAADGRTAGRVQVEATDPAARSHTVYGLPILSAMTDAEGDFEIRDVPPGRYVIGINLKDLPSKLNPYGRTLYPSDGSDGDIVTIGTAQAFDLGTWRLPPPLAVVTVQGLAVSQDGKPAVGVHVGVWDVTGNPVELARGAGGATVDSDGRFVLELRQGRTYTFMARDKNSALLSVAGPRLVVGSTAPDPVRLVIGPAIRR